MTNLKLLSWQRHSFLLLFLAFLLLTGQGCENSDDIPSDVLVNPAFEMAPPITQNVTLQLLEESRNKGKFLLVANLGKEQIKGNFHALMIDEEKIVLRDDGKGGDEEKGDGKFSIVIEEDLPSLAAHLDSLNKRNLNTDGILALFRGRIMEKIDSKNLRDFNPREALLSKKAFLFPKDILKLLIPADPLLKSRSLMITDPAVVQDPNRTFSPCGTGNPNGVWSFGHLIREMANSSTTGITPEAFLDNMLHTWMSPQLINGDNVAARPGINQIINLWQSLSGGTLNVDRAPFKLIAIVNRIDLRGSSGYGFSNAGEGRFVFCAVDANCNVIRNPAPFMIIFEYGVPIKGCAILKAYAQEWFNLKTMTPGTPAYNAALENITTQFTEAGQGGTKPNGSALNQLRTNELALGINPWELREFVIDATSHLLTPTTVKQEPQITFNQVHPGALPADVQILANFTNAHQIDVENDKHKIPLVETGRNMLAGKAHTLDPVNYHWNASTSSAASDFINSDRARFKLSLNTCSGCHGGETITNNFMHVAPGPGSGVPATLSGFLTGNPPGSSSPWVVTDRAGRTSTPASGWEFNDLERRAKDLQDFVATPCKPKLKIPVLVRMLTVPPLVMTH